MIYEKIRKAQRVGCPIVTLGTSDPAAAVVNLCRVFGDKHPVITWDCLRSLRGANRIGETAIASAPEDSDFIETLEFAAGLQAGSVLVMQNAHRFLETPHAMQAIWNLRDQFKNPSRLLVLMGPSVEVPAELRHDVIAFDEPLPGSDELESVVTSIAEAAGRTMEPEDVTAAARAATGMSAFGAEQIVALNTSQAEGINAAGIWSDKCRKIDDVPGLKVVKSAGPEAVAGCENIKTFLSRILQGSKRPNGIVFVDEIEKAMGSGSAGDTSGVSQDQLGVTLQYMQDKRASGCIFAGPPGSGKSAMAKAAGQELGIPTIQLDYGAMKGSLVGQSENQMREALKVIDAVTGGETLWLATSNDISTLPPELKRRFRYGTYFFDLPSLSERQQIWDLYCTAFGLEQPSEQMLSLDWTGAEIESCCEIVERTGMTMEEAAEYIVPVSRTDAARIERLRTAANGAWLNAGAKGVYRKASEYAAPQAVRMID
jgi:hypothetical protein